VDEADLLRREEKRPCGFLRRQTVLCGFDRCSGSDELWRLAYVAGFYWNRGCPRGCPVADRNWAEAAA